MTRKVVSFLFAPILIVFVAPVGPLAAERDFLAAARATLASEIERGLPDEAIDVWLGDVIGRDVAMSWGINDCGEQTGDPLRDAERDVPVCGELEATLGPGRAVYLYFSVGTQRRGVLEGRDLRFVGILESGDTLTFESLSALAEHLRAENR